jgi:hypothetical protein
VRAATTSSGAAVEGTRPREEAAMVGSTGVVVLGSNMVSRERGEQQEGEPWTGWASEEGWLS